VKSGGEKSEGVVEELRVESGEGESGGVEKE
jgi:hypothetical protein